MFFCLFCPKIKKTYHTFLLSHVSKALSCSDLRDAFFGVQSYFSSVATPQESRWGGVSLASTASKAVANGKLFGELRWANPWVASTGVATGGLVVT